MPGVDGSLGVQGLGEGVRSSERCSPASDSSLFLAATCLLVSRLCSGIKVRYQNSRESESFFFFFFFFCVGSRDRVLLVLTKSMKSPRSALCKSSIMASSDVFHQFGQLLLSSPSSDAFDQLVIKRAPSPIFFWGVPICNGRIQSCIDLCSCCDSC